jgi:hypothetical protein
MLGKLVLAFAVVLVLSSSPVITPTKSVIASPKLGDGPQVIKL